MGRQRPGMPSNAPAVLTATTMTLLALVSGCLGAPFGDDEDLGADAAMTAPRVLDLTLEGIDCDHGGGVAYNPIPQVVANQGPQFVRGPPEPFAWGDVTPYFGTPAPIAGLGIGNAHIGLACAEWFVNGVHSHEPSLGWVALVVDVNGFPEVDHVEHNYLLSTLATRDDVLAAVFEDIGFYVFDGRARVSLGNAGGIGFGSTIIETIGDGHYITDAQVRNTGESWDHLRLWFIVEGADGELHPGYFDVEQPGAEAWLGPGAFTHAFTSDHGPAGRGDSATGSMFFPGIDVRMSGVLLPDVLDGTWTH